MWRDVLSEGIQFNYILHDVIMISLGSIFMSAV